jgi:acyl dehydratase
MVNEPLKSPLRSGLPSFGGMLQEIDPPAFSSFVAPNAADNRTHRSHQEMSKPAPSPTSPPLSTHPRGGLYFEDFAIGHVFRHRLTRTVTQMDNMLFSNMTLNPQPLHIDAHFAATETEWGKPLVNSIFTLGLMVGISVNETTMGTTIGNLGMTDVKFPAPVFEGDTINATSEVAAKRESKSRPNAGIVDFIHRAYKQDGTLVAECRRQAFMMKRPV